MQVDISVADIQNGKLLLDLSGKHLDLNMKLFYGSVPVSDLDITIKCDTIGPMTGSNPIFGFTSNNVRSITFDCNQDYLTVNAPVTGGTGSPNTITYHSTPKGRLATIMGRVESVTNNEETYSKSVEDDSGTMSLQDFITNVKGWTLG